MKNLLRIISLALISFYFISASHAQSTLIHYWSFNSITSAFHNPGIPSITADYSVIDTSKAKVVYALQPGTSSNYAGYWDNNAGDTTNARNGFVAGNALRFRNPSDSSELRVYFPTTNYKNIVIKYALESSSVASGQSKQLFDYSIDSGLTWKTSGLSITTLDVTQAQFQGSLWGLVTISLSGDTAVNNNAKVVFRIKFNSPTFNSGSGNNRFENLTVEGTFIPPPSNVPLSLIHYWNFNNLNTAYHNPGIPPIDADYSAIDTSSARLIYTLIPGTSTNYAGYIDNNPGDLTNARNGAPSGQSLRFRNPSDSAELRLYFQTVNYKNIVIKYALQSSSVGSGQKTQLFDYSVDDGQTWKTSGLSINSLDVTQPQFQGANWGFVTVNLSADTTVNNNYGVVFRIKFSGNTTGGSGNNRFDNISIEGTYVPPVAAIYTWVSPSTGSSITVGKHAAINFSASGPVGSLRRVEYSTNRGLTWNFIALISGTSVDWIVPNTPATNVFIRVVDEKSLYAGVNQITIFYPGPGVINVTKPAKGDTLFYGSTVSLSFTVSGVVSDTRFIDYSIDSGKSWKNIGSVFQASNLNWLIPNVLTSQAFIRVSDTANVIGISGPFYIAPVPVTNVSLAVIDYWNFDNIVGDTISQKKPSIADIHPDYSSLDASKAKLQYYLLPGTSFSSLRYVDPVSPGADTNKRSVVASGAVNNALRLRNPLDSMELRCYLPTTGHTNIIIKYALESSSTKSGDSTNIYDYSIDGGLTWKNGKANGMKVNGSNVDTLDTTPAVFQGTSWGLVTIDLSADKTVENNPNFILRIRFKGNTSLTSGNNRFDNFTVEGVGSTTVTPPTPAITIITPSKGDTLVTGSVEKITFTTTGAVSAKRVIEYSPNGGTIWNNVATITGITSYDWTLPSTPSPSGTIRVSDTTGVIGLSGKFAIVQPGTVISVKVGATPGSVLIGQTADISWITSGYLGNTVNIDLSLDTMKTWTTIKSAYAYSSSSSYAWTAPTTPHAGAVIRITFASGAQGFSNPFNINVPAAVNQISEEKAISIWPNPLSSNTTIRYFLTESSDVSFSIYNVMGKEVTLISIGNQSVGLHSMNVDCSNLPCGTYYYALRNGKQFSNGKMVVAR